MLPDYYPNWIKSEYTFFENHFSGYVNSLPFQGIPSSQFQYGLFPGRRTRPTLFLAFAKSLEIPITENLLGIAHSIEFFHRASLLLDDILDGEDTRRKLTVFHKKFGSANAILLSQYYISEGLQLLSKYDGSLLSSWIENFQKIIIGEYLDINSKQNEVAPFEKIVKKTVGFFEFMGATLCEYSSHTHLIKLFSLLGKAFQISNDYFDAAHGVVERSAKSEIIYSNSLVQSIIAEESRSNLLVEEAIITSRLNDLKKSEKNLNVIIQEIKIIISKLTLPNSTKKLADDFLDLLLIKDYWYHEYAK